MLRFFTIFLFSLLLGICITSEGWISPERVEHQYHTGILCFHQDRNEVESWLKKGCEKVIKACSQNADEQCIPSGIVKLENFKKQLEKTELKNYMHTEQFRMIVLVSAHGACPEFPKVGEGDWRSCGGMVGPYKMTNFIRIWQAFYQYRKETLKTESLLVVNACFSGCLLNSDEYTSAPFPIFTTKGEGSGSVLVSTSHLILDPFVELMSRRILVSKPLSSGSMAHRIKERVMPFLKLLQSNERRKYIYPGLIMDPVAMKANNEEVDRESSNFGWQLLSPVPFSFPDWNLDPTQVLFHGIATCQHAPIYSVEFDMDGRFHQQPLKITANHYTKADIIPPNGWGRGHRFRTLDRRNDLEPIFLGYDTNGKASFLANYHYECPRGEDIHVKIYYGIGAVYLFKLKSNIYVRDYAYEITEPGELCSSPKRLIRSNHECFDFAIREGLWESNAIATVQSPVMAKGCVITEFGLVLFNDISPDNELNFPDQMLGSIKSVCRAQGTVRDMVWAFGELNTLCPVSTKINSLGECTDALLSLDIRHGHDGVQGFSGQTNEFPSGCTFEAAQKATHWNVGDGPAGPEFQPLCRVPRAVNEDVPQTSEDRVAFPAQYQPYRSPQLREMTLFFFVCFSFLLLFYSLQKGETNSHDYILI